MVARMDGLIVAMAEWITVHMDRSKFCEKILAYANELDSIGKNSNLMQEFRGLVDAVCRVTVIDELSAPDEFIDVSGELMRNPMRFPSVTNEPGTVVDKRTLSKLLKEYGGFRAKDPMTQELVLAEQIVEDVELKQMVHEWIRKQRSGK
jgi:hypothetical protein